MGRETKPLKSQVNDRLFTYKLIKAKSIRDALRFHFKKGERGIETRVLLLKDCTDDFGDDCGGMD